MLRPKVKVRDRITRREGYQEVKRTLVEDYGATPVILTLMVGLMAAMVAWIVAWPVTILWEYMTGRPEWLPFAAAWLFAWIIKCTLMAINSLEITWTKK